MIIDVLYRRFFSSMTFGCLYCVSVSINRAWAAVRQERYKVGRISEGLVTTWGTGENGELGLGPYVKYCPNPTAIPKLRGICIIQISAGQNHVLAISDARHLYRCIVEIAERLIALCGEHFDLYILRAFSILSVVV